MTRSYQELLTFLTYEDRIMYLEIKQRVSDETFGSSRYLNQDFYQSKEWRNFRHKVIVRDLGCDLGLAGYEIHGPIYIHHINPLSKADIINRSNLLFDLNNVVCVSFDTHQLIHYGFSKNRRNILVERVPGDTRLW